MSQVALSKDFLEAYSRLPKVQQKKVRDFTEKFRRDPTQPGINLEKVQEARDDKVRSVRIDQAYRAIVVHPPKGDVYLCVWVDHHDEAYRWARNKVFEVNPTSGAFQLYEMPEAATVAPPPAEERPARGLFAELDDEDLLLAGVPGPLLPAVRAVQSEDGLDKLAPHLPEEASEMLFLMAAGYGLMEALEETERSKASQKDVDVENFEQALSKSESQRQFAIVEDETQLGEILDAPLEQWRIFLHPTQRRLVEMQANGPVRVLGGAGTGKTVVLMHRARHLARHVFNADDDRLLVTTFTRNLALDLGMNLRNLCGPEFPRLEIVNLHSWAARFMRRHGVEFRIIPEYEKTQLWEMACAELDSLDFPVSFYIDEWDQIVQHQNIDSRDAYFGARRVGRGTRLGRKQRAAVWKVCERYRHLLNDGGWVEWADVIRETRLFILKQGISLPYRAVLSDEVQDFAPNDLMLLRTLVPEGASDLYLVGDGHQRIYARETRLGRCGINIRGRSKRLKLNYRTTEQIRNRAVAILENCEIDDLDGGLDSLKGYRSLRVGQSPEVRFFEKESEEARYISHCIRDWLGEVKPEAICLAARTRSLLRDRYLPILEAAGIDAILVETDPETEAKRPGVRVATMHRMKGLEFKRVLLAGTNDGVVPLSIRTGFPDDQASQADHERRERCLFYVASTRARDSLVITGFGTPSSFIKANNPLPEQFEP